VRIVGSGPLRGTVRTPGDKSISHRALLLAALAEGESTLGGLSDGDDVLRTLAAVRSLGADVTVDGMVVSVSGGRDRLRPPPAPIDCGNSGTGLRLLAGIAAGLNGETTLTGDGSLSARPMDRIAEPLRAMGAGVEGHGARCFPPLTVSGGRLCGISWSPPVASAQIKSAVLLAGLGAVGETVVREAIATRAHTEELLAAAGAAVTVRPWGSGREIRLQPSALRPLHIDVPGDPSQAAFWMVAACLVEGSEVRAEKLYTGSERIGFVGVLRRMGAAIEVERDGTMTSRSALLSGTEVEAAEIPSLDEVPVLAVAAAAAHGTTVFHDVGELRVKESDRLAAVAAMVEQIGATAEVHGDDLRIEGTGGRLDVACIDSGGDHRIAMAGAVAALAAGGGEVRGFDSVATSYPAFLTDLVALGGRVAVEVIAIDGPAGSGKSTVSRTLAEHLGMDRLDTGAMYRAVAWAALERGVEPSDQPAVASIAATAVLAIDSAGVRIDGSDVTGAIRSPAVSEAVSVVAANPEVRRHLVARQRRWVSEHGGGVVEGRDIGTVVFPEARLKVYLTASPEERARRRSEEPATGVARRDRLDSTRAASPLIKADDARLLDTTGRSVEDVVKEVLSWL